MKQLLFLFCLPLLLWGCAAKYYNYKFSMYQPQPTEYPLTYENDTLQIKFRFTPQRIAFDIRNKMDDAIKINWDEVSLSVDSKTYKVVHNETGILRINDLQPPSTIPPQSTLSDAIVPKDMIRVRPGGSLSKSGSPLAIDALFPNYANRRVAAEYILPYKGKKVVVYMPFYVAGKYVAKSFYFNIDDIVASTKKEAGTLSYVQ